MRSILSSYLLTTHLSTTRCYLGSLFSREYAKKYSYDLDALVQWKKETHLIFGSPRKPTKTGKIRKSIKSEKNDQLNATLELMSAQSIYRVNEKFGIDSESFDNSHKHSHKSSENSDPGFSTDNEKELDKVLHLERETNKEKTSKTKVSVTEQECFSSNKNSPVFPEGLDIFPHDSQNNVEKEKNITNEVVIPVIQPIPLKSMKPFRLQKPPVEPPSSFNVINQFPLVSVGVLEDEEMKKKVSEFKIDVDSMSLRKIPSVKYILSKTRSDINQFFLQRWRENMIKELGEEGFKTHQDATIQKGVNFHTSVMNLLSGKPATEIQVMADNEGHWASLQTAMSQISGVRTLEEDLFHPALMYRGILDCVGMYKDVLCVIDWKTSKKPRPLLKNTYDDPVQVAAYCGLVNGSERNVMKFGSVNHGLLVVVYPDGKPAHIHHMNPTVCQQYWKDWCDRLYTFYQLTYTEMFS